VPPLRAWGLSRGVTLGQAQCSPSAHGSITSHFRPQPYLLSASVYRQEMTPRYPQCI